MVSTPSDERCLLDVPALISLDAISSRTLVFADFDYYSGYLQFGDTGIGVPLGFRQGVVLSLFFGKNSAEN